VGVVRSELNRWRDGCRFLFLIFKKEKRTVLTVRWVKRTSGVRGPVESPPTKSQGPGSSSNKAERKRRRALG